MSRLRMSMEVVDPEILTLLARLEQHDIGTYAHSMRVAEYCDWFAGHLNMRRTDRERFFHSALLHDIGKLKIPSDILNKKSRLTDEEWHEIRKHPLYGMEFVRELVASNIVMSDIITMHHENTDGTGYPYNSRTLELPAQVRIIRVIDSFDAMTGNRSYQLVKTVDEALDELIRCQGTLYDPEIVRLFCAHIQNGNQPSS
ncbi:HD-GYP domain-containing protein [Paenibacillus xanthanilyticus]|uniref:HD-GYP domain-containing protein n=1 Tax=Paenibacillus xanthanilyticus TaxID=1783531 RepID=A0ABV8K0E2_9BACL